MAKITLAKNPTVRFTDHMKAARLLQHISLYPALARFRCKKDIPKGTQGFPVLADFGLWGQWWLVRSFGGLLLADGREMPFHIMHCRSGEVVLGQHDLTAAEGTKYAEAWRESYREVINERLQRVLA